MMNYIASTSGAPWSNQTLDPNMSINELLEVSRLDFEYEKLPVEWTKNGDSSHSDKHFVILRSDNNQCLSTVGKDFIPVQPRDVVSFYKSICTDGGFRLDALGQVDGGARIWGLAATPLRTRVLGQDEIESFLFFVTGNDGSLSTRIQLISKRLVCNNMLDAAIRGNFSRGSGVTFRHSRQIPYSDIARSLRSMPSDWGAYVDKINTMARTPVTTEDAYKFFWKMYETKQQSPKALSRKVDGLMGVYLYDTTQQLRSTQNTVWGLVNAVTYWQDHRRKSRTEEARFKSSMMGDGERQKKLAWKDALALVS